MNGCKFLLVSVLRSPLALIASFLSRALQSILPHDSEDNAVNSNEAGTGKSIEALASVFFLAQRREAQPGFAAHRATLILCPHQALRGWQEAHAKFFSSLLTLHVCSKSFRDYGHGKFVDPESLSALTAVLERMEPSDPQTSYNIILSTYEDFSSKAFLKERKQKVLLGNKEFSVRGAKFAPEAHEGISIGQKPVLFDLDFESRILERIGTLVADEAHEIKNPRTRKAQAAYLVNADINFLLTASPTDNKISDFRGLLFALFKPKEWLINWPSGVAHGELFPMYSNKFDPLGGKDHAGVIPDLGEISPQYMEALRNGQHLWRLNPHAYRWLGNQMKFSQSFAEVVLSSIFRLCVLRRDPDSVVDLPGGIKRTVADIVGIPRVTTKTVELKMNDEEQNDYYFIAEPWFKKLFNTGDENVEKTSNAARILEANEVPNASFDKAQNAKLNYITADLNLVEVFKLQERYKDTLNDPNSKNEAIEAEKLYGQDKDAGMAFYYAMTRYSENPIEPPPDRVYMIKHLVQRAPKLRWLLVKLDELKQRNEKAVVFCAHPRTRWIIEGVCSMAEFSFYSLKSTHDKDQIRPKVLADFNDPAKRVDFLLATMELVGSGYDLSRDCHNMISFELPESIPMMMSAIDRIHRAGQAKPQEVSILTLAGSYDDYTLHRHFRKYSINLVAQGVFSGLFDAKQHLASPQVAAGELIRRRLGARVNRSITLWRRIHKTYIVTLTQFHPSEFRFCTQVGKSTIDSIIASRGTEPDEGAQDGGASAAAGDGGAADKQSAREERGSPGVEEMDVDAPEHPEGGRSSRQPGEHELGA